MSYRYGCGYGVGAGPSRTPEIIWDARLDLLPLSTSANAATLRAALAAMGLTLTRASAATVQTSASEVVTSGIGVDDPRVGDAGYGRGLVIEEARTNQILRAIEIGTLPWGKQLGTEVYGVDSSAAPNGATEADSVTTAASAAGGVVQNWAAYTAGNYAASVWAKAVSGSQSFNFRVPNAVGVSNQTLATQACGSTWERKSSTAVVTGGPGTGGTVIMNVGAAAYALYLWGAQLESGKFATEAILTTGAAATRAAENLTLAPNVSRSGFLALEWKFVSKAATGSYSVNTVPLWTGPNGDYIGFHGVNRNVLLYLGGVVYSSAAGAISWAAGDVVEIFVSCGGGAAGVFRYRVNGGAVTTVVIASGGATPVLPTYASGGVLLQSGSASCWLQRIRAYAPGRRPSWCA